MCHKSIISIWHKIIPIFEIEVAGVKKKLKGLKK